MIIGTVFIEQKYYMLSRSQRLLDIQTAHHHMYAHIRVGMMNGRIFTSISKKSRATACQVHKIFVRLDIVHR